MVAAAAEATRLLERDSVLGDLRDALAGAAARRGRFVLVAGEAGVGKSAAVRAFCAEAGGSARVLWGGCDALVTPRPLGPFLEIAEEAVAELAGSAEVDASELHRLTGGNPFFVTEVLASGNSAIPPTVTDAVLARAARLSGEARAVLDAVAIIPPQADLWLLEAIAGESMAGLDACLGSGMLRPERAGVAFRHELARLALEASVAPQRKLELH